MVRDLEKVDKTRRNVGELSRMRSLFPASRRPSGELGYKVRSSSSIVVQKHTCNSDEDHECVVGPKHQFHCLPDFGLSASPQRRHDYD